MRRRGIVGTIALGGLGLLATLQALGQEAPARKLSLEEARGATVLGELREGQERLRLRSGGPGRDLAAIVSRSVVPEDLGEVLGSTGRASGYAFSLSWEGDDYVLTAAPDDAKLRTFRLVQGKPMLAALGRAPREGDDIVRFGSTILAPRDGKAALLRVEAGNEVLVLADGTYRIGATEVGPDGAREGTGRRLILATAASFGCLLANVECPGGGAPDVFFWARGEKSLSLKADLTGTLVVYANVLKPENVERCDMVVRAVALVAPERKDAPAPAPAPGAKAENERAAIELLKRIVAAETEFREYGLAEDGQLRYGTLAELVKARLLEGEAAGGRWHGYVVEVRPSTTQPEFRWGASARPETKDSGSRWFFANQRGHVFASEEDFTLDPKEPEPPDRATRVD